LRQKQEKENGQKQTSYRHPTQPPTAVTFTAAKTKKMAVAGGAPSYLAQAPATIHRGVFPFKTRTPYTNTAGREGYFSLPSDPAKQARLPSTFAEFQNQIIINEALLVAGDGYYSWILKAITGGPTILVAGRILSPQEIGTLHINLDMFTVPGNVLYAGELLKRADTIVFNLASGTFTGAAILRQIPPAERKGLKKIEEVPPTFAPPTDLAASITRLRDAGIAAFTDTLRSKPIGFTGAIQFAAAATDATTPFQDRYMGVPLVTPDTVIAGPAMFDVYAARFNWTPVGIANMGAAAAGGRPARAVENTNMGAAAAGGRPARAVENTNMGVAAGTSRSTRIRRAPQRYGQGGGKRKTKNKTKKRKRRTN
jgi:hypothetical protein